MEKVGVALVAGGLLAKSYGERAFNLIELP